MLVDAKHVFCRYAPFVETDSSSAYLLIIGVSISIAIQGRLHKYWKRRGGAIKQSQKRDGPLNTKAIKQSQKRNGPLNAKAIKQNQKRNELWNAKAIKQSQKLNGPLKAKAIKQKRAAKRQRYWENPESALAAKRV